MTDHRAEALALIEGAAAIVHTTDEEHAGASLPDRMIATQTAAITASLSTTHALLYVGEQLAALAARDIPALKETA